MKIASLTALAVRIPLRRAIKHASHSRRETDNLIVRCVLEDGTTGYGEGVPRAYVTGETIESAIGLVRDSHLGEQFRTCRSWEDAVGFAESLHLATVAGDNRQCQGNAARCAVELAVLDAYGRYFGQSVSDATRILAPDIFEPRDRVQYSGAITSARGWKLKLVALAMRVFGFHQLKVKVGIQGQDDVRRLRTVRKWAGRRMELRVDANEAWTIEALAGTVAELAACGITSIEQPVLHREIHKLAAIRPKLNVPIMFDESLCSLIDARRAIAEKLCDLFNLRLSKCGGFIPTLRLAQLARLHGLGYQLGCQVGETAILSAAGRHFATSVAGLRYLEGSYDRHLVREALGTRDITFGRGGWAPGLTAPGLGIDVDPAALQRVTLREEPLLG